MTDWNAIKATAKPDTLEKVHDRLTGALVPMVAGMIGNLTDDNLSFLLDELWRLHLEVFNLREKVRRDRNTV